MEVDVDAICDGKTTYVAGIMEHIENAGIHSGIQRVLPPPDPRGIVEQIKNTRAIWRWPLCGWLVEYQFAIKGSRVIF